MDPETGISLLITMTASLGVNVMTVFGVFRKHYIWIVPFFVLYMGFCVECLVAIFFTLGKMTKDEVT